VCSISVYHLFQQKKILVKIQLVSGSPLAARSYRLLDPGKASLYALLLLRHFSSNLGEHGKMQFSKYLLLAVMGGRTPGTLAFDLTLC